MAEDITVIVDYAQHGQSAYELALSLGFEGTLEEWVASLQGGANTYIQSFAQASGLTTAAVLDLIARLNSSLPLATGAATDNSLKLIVDAIKAIPTPPAFPNTLAKTTDFINLATSQDIKDLTAVVQDLTTFIKGYADANGNANAIVDALGETLTVKVKTT